MPQQCERDPRRLATAPVKAACTITCKHNLDNECEKKTSTGQKFAENRLKTILAVLLCIRTILCDGKQM